jgi:hypothetical protein
MARASQGARAILEREDIDVVLDLIERCLVEHANFSHTQQVG